MTTTAISPFPAHRQKMENLVEQHKEIRDEPLLLAVYYEPERDAGDLFLLEVIDQFGANKVDPDRELFEVTYGSTAGLPLEPGQELHLILTNPAEAVVAFEEGWPLAREIRGAIEQKKAVALHQTREGERIWETIRG